ncbi:sensor histidine kinase [Pantoea sp. 1.19]|uniref:sensor histidine kinase n=1 Tax=Pantoea sp. 1.19 TaxID=1925589 RepID=UPI000948E04D|nr:sensor histidine kinase [Pantoea sp. 1.19]
MNNTVPPSTRRARPLKLSTTVTLMIGAVLASVLLVVHLFYLFQISEMTRQRVQDKALAVARTLADSPVVRDGLTQPPTDGAIQALARQVMVRNDLLFVVVTNMDGIRYSHPRREAIGQHFIGEDLNPALAGRENIAVNRGVLARALRVFAPVYDAQHRQIGVVAIGIALSDLAQQVNKSRWGIVWTVLFGTLVGTLGTVFLVRVLKRILFGLEPYEISALFEQRQAMLQAIKEGIIALDARGEVTLINEQARQLCRHADASEKQHHTVLDEQHPLLRNLRDVLQNGQPRRDEEFTVNGRLLISNTVPVRSQGALLGAICTFRDKTEVTQLMQRLTGMVNYADALRERSHEFMNKLHVILGLLHMKSYAQLEAYILKTANTYQAEIGSLLRQIKSPVIAGFLLSKINRASDGGHQLIIDDASFLPDSGNEQQVATLITVLGNLIENALDALADQPDGEIHLLLHYQQGWLACEVGDDGPGIPAGRLAHIFDKGWSTKGEQRGVGLFLARQQIESLGGKIIVESEPGVYTQFFVQLPWDGGNVHA